MFGGSALATVTPTTPSPVDDATGVWVNTPTLSVLLNCTNGTQMNGTITCVETGDTFSITAQTNGTQTLTFPSGSLPLTGLTTYQWWVNASDLDGWTNTSYNFTTGSPARLSDQGLNAQQLLLVGLLSVVMLLVVLFVAIDMIKEKKPDAKKLVTMLIAVVILVVALGFI